METDHDAELSSMSSEYDQWPPSTECEDSDDEGTHSSDDGDNEAGVMAGSAGTLGGSTARYLQRNPGVPQQPAVATATATAPSETVPEGVLAQGALAHLGSFQSPSLVPSKAVLNIHNNRQATLLHRTPNGTRGVLCYGGSACRSSVVALKSLRSCPYGGSGGQSLVATSGVEQAIVVRGGVHTGKVGILQASYNGGPKGNVHFVDQGGVKSGKATSVEARYMGRVCRVELGAKFLTPSQAAVLRKHATGGVGDVLAALGTALDTAPLDGTATGGAGAAAAPGAGTGAYGGDDQNAREEVDTAGRRTWRVPRVELLGFMLRLQIEDCVDYNLVRIHRWGSAKVVLQQMASGMQYPDPSPLQRKYASCSLQCCCRAERRPSKLPEDARRSSRRVGCPHTLQLSVMTNDAQTVLVEELALHARHQPGGVEDERYLRLVPEVVHDIEGFLSRHAHSPADVLQLVQDGLADYARPYIASCCLTPEAAAMSRRFNPTAADVKAIQLRYVRAHNQQKGDRKGTHTFLRLAHRKKAVLFAVTEQVLADPVEEQTDAEQIGAGHSGLEQSGEEQREVEWSGVGHSRLEPSGAEAAAGSSVPLPVVLADLLQSGGSCFVNGDRAPIAPIAPAPPTNVAHGQPNLVMCRGPCDIPGMPNGPPLRDAAMGNGRGHVAAADEGVGRGGGAVGGTGGRVSREMPMGPVVLQRFRLTFTTVWMKEMLEMYGKNIVLMDASYGLDVYHYPLVVLMVVDHWGSGIPVAFGIIASHEASEDVAGFIEDVEDITGVTIKNFLIDKSTGEIAALQGLGHDYYLCHFHLKKAVQDWLRGKGITKEARDRIVSGLDGLIYAKTRAEFDGCQERFLRREDVKSAQGFVTYYGRNWGNIAERWSMFGRHFDLTTTNHIKRFFRLLKYTILWRRAHMPLSALVRQLVTKVVPYFERQYAARAARFQLGRHDHKAQHYRRVVALLVQQAASVMHVVDVESGTVTVSSIRAGGADHLSCLADGSCTCKPGSTGAVCVHLEASYRVHGGGADGARSRAEQLGASLSSARRPLVARRAADVTVFRSQTTRFIEASKAELSNGPQWGSRLKAVVDGTGTDLSCTCSLFGTHGRCAHTVAVETTQPERAGGRAVDFSLPLCYTRATPVQGPTDEAVEGAARVGRKEATVLRGLCAPPTLYRGAVAMRAGGETLTHAQATQQVLKELQQLLSNPAVPAEVVRAALVQLRGTAAVMAAAADAAAAATIDDAPESAGTPESAGEALLVTPSSRPSRDTDRRASTDRVVRQLVDPRRRQRRRKKQGGTGYSDEEGSDEWGQGDGEEEEEANGPALVPAAAKRKPRTKGGLRE